MSELEIGVVTHYFNHLQVAGVKLTGTIHVGDTVHVVGHTSDFTAHVGSLQIEHHDVEEAGPGDAIGLKVPETAREHDKVFKIMA